MLTIVKNYDLICYHLRNSLYSQLENPLKKDIDKLSKDIINIINSSKKIQSQSVDILAQLFNLRVKAIKWLSQHNNFNYLEMLSEVSNQIEEIGENKKMEILKENILFALRCNRRIIESLFSAREQSEILNIDFTQLPDINYQQFLASLAFAIPDDETAQKIADWTNASLHIEFVMLAADIIIDEKIKVSEKSINELSFLVADAAQEYSALATEFGILKTKANQQTLPNQPFDKGFVNEQKTLADIGIEDFASNFTN
ncbi:hypothetical protein BXY57_0358 [Thermoflavifilum aggregans]|uniref:Uncharacterized protein n=1 Tax=Thermoflavifilum aggregans TaxID=454188 RepID=A0A2M9CS73_9BACT|nr:hypothetical protein [Thermoflavifilum aggregans]PJJ74796.1 hypothetical protein BXY57_0358 [Thermoflavifilum aggregans]